MQKEEIIDGGLGYRDSGDNIRQEDGSLISPSANVIYTRDAKLVSIKDLQAFLSNGGSKAFVLDDDLFGFLGSNNTTGKATGNILQSQGKSIWFVGNTINNAVQVIQANGTPYPIGGTHQVETVTVTAGATANGNLTVRVTGANVTGSPVDTTVAVLNGDSTSTVATKVAKALRTTTVIYNEYECDYSGSDVILTDRDYRANDGTLAITLQAAGGTGVTFGGSTNTTSGALDYLANLSDIPQYAKWNGAGWDAPLQVGLAPQSTAPELVLTDDTTRGSDFVGTVTGSVSARLARKRFGAVSIASEISNVVTADADSFFLTVPAYLEDGSDHEDREWYIYFTYTGQGSQAAHLLFPITITENELDGSTTPSLHVFGNARAKVVSQHASAQANRKIEIEFLNNDLLLLPPFEDYYPAESCRFMFQLGNIMCLVGTGEDGTGFDISKPDNFEAYNPDDRQWLSEVPVAVVNNPEQGFAWILTKHTVWKAVWTGAMEETPPIILREVTSKFGAMGENTVCSINGVLFFLSAGKTPITISPEDELNKEFGTRVKNHFSSYDENDCIEYDEDTNSVVWFHDKGSIAYQIDNDIWGAPCTFTTNGVDNIDFAFAFDGRLYVCYYNSTDITPSYETLKYNGSGNLNWNWTTNFRYFGSLHLKDIVEGLLVVESPAQPYTITVKAYKDFDTSSAITLFSYSGTVTGTKISTVQYIESLDYESMAIRVEGTIGGQTNHYLSLWIDTHQIERR